MSVKVGDVFRMMTSHVNDDTSQVSIAYAFSDCYVSAVEDMVYLVRPYVLSDGTVGAERFETDAARLTAPNWVKVDR